MAKGFGIALVGLLAVAGGVAAAAYLTKKKLDKENEADYYDEWDDADECISDTAAETAAIIAEVNKQNDELIEEDGDAPEDAEGQL